MAPLPSKTPHVDLVAAIAARKTELNAVILAHYYQVDEVQDVADFIGDSLQLAREAAETDADVIVFCGVHFMAETAKILSPHKTGLLPDIEAGCSLADSAPEKEFKAFVEANPHHTVVTYVNSSAAVKALSDYCVTSSNAVDVVKHIGADKKIIFAPDKFLGDWVKQEADRDMLLWDGACEVHEMFSEQAIRELQQENEGCITLVHPECPAPVRDLGDVVGSTKRLLEAVIDGAADACYIVVTEPGIIHKMQAAAPEATFIMAPAELLGSAEGSCISCNTCPHMRLNTLDKLYNCMMDLQPQIELPKAIIERARLPIERMLSIG